MVVVIKNDINKDAISINYTEHLGSWSIPLMDLLTSDYMENLMNFVSQKQLSAEQLYPIDQKQLFKAFKLCNYDDLKVVIIGNKPYANIKANGLAYGNDINTAGKTSPALANIESCVCNTMYGFRDNAVFDTTLETWAAQGVLLLNTSLTTQIGEDHSIYWKNFTREVLKTINDKKEGIVFMFLDNTCEYFKQYLGYGKHKVLSNNSIALKSDCDIFIKADSYLYDNKKGTITW